MNKEYLKWKYDEFGARCFFKHIRNGYADYRAFHKENAVYTYKEFRDKFYGAFLREYLFGVDIK